MDMSDCVDMQENEVSNTFSETSTPHLELKGSL